MEEVSPAEEADRRNWRRIRSMSKSSFPSSSWDAEPGCCAGISEVGDDGRNFPAPDQDFPMQNTRCFPSEADQSQVAS